MKDGKAPTHLFNNKIQVAFTLGMLNDIFWISDDLATRQGKKLEKMKCDR